MDNCLGDLKGWPQSCFCSREICVSTLVFFSYKVGVKILLTLSIGGWILNGMAQNSPSQQNGSLRLVEMGKWTGIASTLAYKNLFSCAHYILNHFCLYFSHVITGIWLSTDCTYFKCLLSVLSHSKSVDIAIWWHMWIYLKQDLCSHWCICYWSPWSNIGRTKNKHTTLVWHCFTKTN
jgi:hypothetical protein